jgi:hypothetical protein
MRLVVGALVVLAGAMTQAIADPPAAPQSSSTEAAAPATAQTTSTTTKTSMSSEEENLRAQGYKPKMQNGQKVWCRSETPIGTRLSHGDTCASAEQIKARTQSGRDATDTAQRTMMNPMSNGKN